MAALKPFVEHLENDLTCSICQEIFTDPKALPCMHSYCAKCIVQWYERSGNQITHRFNCPICKARIDVPDGDATKLRSSFYLDSLLLLLRAMKTKTNQQGLPDCTSCEKPAVMVAFCPQCNGLICADCVNAHKAIKTLRDEHKQTLLNEFKQENVAGFIKNQMLCKEKFHEKNKLEYYCQEETCRRCVCQKCATLFHQNHRMQSLEEAAEDVKQVVQQDIDRVKQLKKNYEDELEKSKKNIQRIEKDIDLAKKEVRHTGELIIKMVRDHIEATIDSLGQTQHDQKTANEKEQSVINTGIEQLSDLPTKWEKLSGSGLPYEMIESKKDLQQICQTLLETPSVLSGEPIQRDMTVRYVTNHKVVQSLQDIGKIVKSVPDPSKSTIESPKIVLCGFESNFKIITRDTEGEVCHTRIESIGVKIKDLKGNEVGKKVFEEQGGKYRVSYKADEAGPYEIQVNIGGKPVKNSPQNVNTLDVKKEFKPLKVFGGMGCGKGQFNTPQSIALGNNGEIAITDCLNHRIQIFNRGGKYLREFNGRKGNGKGKLFEPFGFVFNEDKVFVSDGPNDRGELKEFDFKGTYVRTIYRPEEWFVGYGMCVNDDNDIAVCCWGNEKLGIKPSIKLFSKQGVLFNEFYSTDNEHPEYITYGNGKYFVSYIIENYIRVFDKNLVFLNKFGEKGDKNGQFQSVRGLAVYGPDMILVCDSGNNRVQLLTQEGQFISSFGSFGSGLGQMVCPTDVAVTADDQVYVLEECGNRVQVWC